MSSTVRFLLDGNVVEVDNPDPTRTVLQFLREDLYRTGTKEGCAEGDCGACTVVLVELNRSGDDVQLRAVNSCIQFLATLDGKELLTVESLAPAGELHPVQRAMVEQHGSQCGFCTPGFVMSLFALYKTQDNPARIDINDALAGNLCRCTGYRPIVAAAQSMYITEGNGDWLQQPANTNSKQRADALRNIARQDALSCEVDGRTFHAPRTMAEALAVLARYPDATLLAGGTDVGLWVTKQHRTLAHVIYLGHVAELLSLNVSDDAVEIGAGVTITEAMPLLAEHFPQLDELLARFASPPIRNAGTFGGNVANGSPIGDSMAAFIALGADIVLVSADGERRLPLDSFYQDYMVNDLRPGEILQSIVLPRQAPAAMFATYKISKRFDQDISAVSAAFSVRIEDERISTARIAFGGMAATVKRALHCEQALVGQPWQLSTFVAAADALAKDYAPIDDMRSTADYRLRVSQNLLQRFFHEIKGGAPHSLYRYGVGK